MSTVSDLAKRFKDNRSVTRRIRWQHDLLEPPKGPAILLYDIETSPTLAWVWDAYDTNIIDVEREWALLCFAYQWFGTDKIGWAGAIQDPRFVPDKAEDLYVARRLAALFDRADVTVAHNGDRFDRRKANVRFRANGIDPPSPYQTVDTLKISRREFGEIKHNLNYLANKYHDAHKLPNIGFPLWRGCMAGDLDSWSTMERYNRRDVELLEGQYLDLMPWLPPGSVAPNMGHFTAKGDPICPRCGSAKMNPNGIKRTPVSEYQAWRCQDCRGIAHSRNRKTQRHDGGVRVK